MYKNHFLARRKDKVWTARKIAPMKGIAKT